MMAYTTVPTVATGDTWSAANHNTYIKDNFAAVWPGTTAGDMDYYTSATAKSRLAIGTSGTVLTSSGTAPQWSATSALTNTPGSVHAVGWIETGAGSAGASYTDVVSVTLTTTKTCTIIAMASVNMNSSGASKYSYVRLSIDGTTNPSGNNVGMTYGTSVQNADTNSQKTGTTAGSKVVKVQVSADAAATTTIVGGSLIAFAVVE
jgi:hypothetical protein